MKLIQTVDAEGTVLCHDITQIIKGVTKDAVFRKGHVVTREDIPVLLSVGKDQLYVWEKEDDKTRFMDYVHNDSYLKNNQGKYAEPNSLYSPFQ